MNWHCWQTELSQISDELSNRMEHLAEESQLTGGVWGLEEIRHRALIDDICKDFAETKSWPIGMSQKHIVLIYFRLIQAELRAQELAQSSHSPVQSSVELDLERAAALKYLLVDYWHSHGRMRWTKS